LAAVRALVLILAILAAAAAAGKAEAAPSDRVLVMAIDGSISIAAARHVARVIDQAKRENAAAVVIRLDTPGGLVTATRDMIAR
jgi:membrane-bound serine protease (ClpP class)